MFVGEKKRVHYLYAVGFILSDSLVETLSWNN